MPNFFRVSIQRLSGSTPIIPSKSVAPAKAAPASEASAPSQDSDSVQLGGAAAPEEKAAGISGLHKAVMGLSAGAAVTGFFIGACATGPVGWAIGGAMMGLGMISTAASVVMAGPQGPPAGALPSVDGAYISQGSTPQSSVAVMSNGSTGVAFGNTVIDAKGGVGVRVGNVVINTNGTVGFSF